MKANAVMERGSTPPGDGDNDETFTTWEKKEAETSKLVNGTQVTAQEKTCLSPHKQVPVEAK